MKIFDIATLGTSLTAGSGATRGFQRDLSLALTPGKQSRIRIYNFGIPGGYSTDGLTRIGQICSLRPKVVLIEFSMNDCLTSIPSASANTKAILNGIKNGSPQSQIFLVVMNPVVGNAPRVNLPTYYQLYRNLAVSENVGLIDTAPVWAGVTLVDIPDGIHPKAEVNRARLVPALAAALGVLVE